jgi:predicted Zn-dependent protease
MIRQFPAALRLYDRAQDILPNDPDLMAMKASVYQAQGNLQEAAKFLTEINAQTQYQVAFAIKITQLSLERNFGEATRLLYARLAQFHFSSEIDKAYVQLMLAFTQRLAGDRLGGMVTAEQARNMIEPLCKRQPDNARLAAMLAAANAARGEKDAAIKQAERAIMLLPTAKDRVSGPAFEENLAEIQMIFGETSRPISTLARLLQTPNADPLTPALLRLDPRWDPLRADPAFQKLCEEKQP